MVIDNSEELTYLKILKGKDKIPIYNTPLPKSKASSSKPIDNSTIDLSIEDKLRLYAPWKFSVISKTVGKIFNYEYLRKKLTDLWKLKENITLVDLGLNFFTIKFNDPTSQSIAIQGGRCFIARAFLSVRVWEPNFVPSKCTIETMTIGLDSCNYP
ncbi:hypothetical protein BC332_01503 [Capsicum chinense]|nr:hypothetical protein BC332_01503 [Capsicum chinense]